MEQYNEDTIVEKACRNSEGWYMKLLRWREDHIPEKSFVVILAIIIGVASGLAAVLLKFLIGTISGLVNSVTEASQANYYYLVFPIIGIFLAGIYVRYVVRDNISHGVTRVLYAIAQKKSRLKFYNMYASLASSSVTIGCGGSVGAEGPYCIYWGGYWFKPWSSLPPLASHADDARWLWCGCRYFRHL